MGRILAVFALITTATLSIGRETKADTITISGLVNAGWEVKALVPEGADAKYLYFLLQKEKQLKICELAITSLDKAGTTRGCFDVN